MNETPSTSSDKLTQEEQRHSWLANKFPEWFPVFGSHVKRIGLFRSFAGGVPMYISIPFFVTFQLMCLSFFSNMILQPILGLKKLRFKDYVIIDRYKIDDLSWFDRINCMYCGYANGLATYFEARIDQVEQWRGNLNFIQKTVVSIGLLIYMPFSYLNRLDHAITYDLLISRPLGLHRLSTKEALLQLESSDKKAGENTGFINKIIRSERIFSLKINNALEQIESSWCPIKHYDERSEAVYPRHHVNFLDHHEIQKMKEILQTDGTVSPNKPYK